MGERHAWSNLIMFSSPAYGVGSWKVSEMEGLDGVRTHQNWMHSRLWRGWFVGNKGDFSGGGSGAREGNSISSHAGIIKSRRTWIPLRAVSHCIVLIRAMWECLLNGRPRSAGDGSADPEFLIIPNNVSLEELTRVLDGKHGWYSIALNMEIDLEFFDMFNNYMSKAWPNFRL